jgi:hypothetical protein
MKMTTTLKHLLTTLLGIGALAAASPALAITINRTNDVTGAETWYATNTYVLYTIVYVQTNAVLSIEPGTIIKAQTDTNQIASRTDIPLKVSGLWVTRGGKLYATGTVSAPIIFTADTDDVDDPNDLPYNYSGKWGGIVLCGRATINSAQNAGGQAVGYPNKYEVFEGTTGNGATIEHVFGGGIDDNDNSGALRYVSIRYGGKEFAAAKELNGLTMGGVGRGTTIEYVEVLNNSDDGFEWWGGTVNCNHLIAAFCEDDDFDTDQGYTGTNQFLFGIKPPWAESSDSRGFETDGDLSQTGYPGGNALPTSTWVAHNVTLIGRGLGYVGTSGGRIWNSRDEARPNIYNGVFTDFNQGVLIDNDGGVEWVNGVAEFRHSIFNVSSNVLTRGTNDCDFLFSNPAYANTQMDPMLRSVSYTNTLGLDPRPQAGSPALTNVLTQPAGLVKTGYRGAFGCADNWADNWTALSGLGFMTRGAVPVPADITANTTWYATNEYRLDTMVYVQSNAVLTIQPGTVVRASTDTNVITSRTDIPLKVSGLWVTRGGKLYATGTVSAPIIFTADCDNLDDPNDLPYNYSGKWGGIVLCGRATINSAQNATGQAVPAPNKYEVFEGTTGNGVTVEHVFGGGIDDNDNSGALRYVSIRYGGKEFAAAKELNGLTMGAVGRGTTIEYVEVLNNSDDGFEWWGGTVNCSHLIAAFCEDDDFDTDQGYTGTNQFLFGIKPPWAESSDSRGFETDGDLSQTGYPGGNAAPTSTWVAHNVTLIGRGLGYVGASGGRIWNSRDEARPNVYNAVFTDFNQGVLIDGDGGVEWVNGVAEFRHSIFNVSSNVLTRGTNDCDFLFSNPAYANTELNPLLGGVSYTNNLGLDPRPQAGSPALTNVLAGAPVVTTYRGAFKPNDSWADGWSALSSNGYLPASAPELSIQLVGGNVEISWLGLPAKTYQLESRSSISSGTWGDEGAAQAGTGDVITVSIPATGEKFFQVKMN